jgi:hypothetical protein
MKQQKIVSIRLTDEEYDLWQSWKRNGAKDADVFRWLAANYAQAQGVPPPAGSGGGTLVANLVRAIRKEIVPLIQAELQKMAFAPVGSGARGQLGVAYGGGYTDALVLDEQAAALFERMADDESWEAPEDDE